MISPQVFERHSFKVSAVRIEHANIIEVAEWCGGILQRPPKRPEYIEVPCGHKDLDRAYNGDWVTQMDGSPVFRVYRNRIFRRDYSSAVGDAEARDNLRKIMHSALDVNLELCRQSPDEVADMYTDLAMKLLFGGS